MENQVGAAAQADRELARAITTAIQANAKGLALPRTIALIESFVDARLKAREPD